MGEGVSKYSFVGKVCLAYHADATCDENSLPTKTVNIQHCWNGCEEHHDSGDTGGEERRGVALETEAIEDEGCVL